MKKVNRLIGTITLVFVHCVVALITLEEAPDELPANHPFVGPPEVMI